MSIEALAKYDSNDYMSMYTPRAKDIKLRPALMVVYEPGK